MSTSPLSLAGHTAIITGGGRGLGKAIAPGLHGAGANVVLGARTAAGIWTEFFGLPYVSSVISGQRTDQ